MNSLKLAIKKAGGVSALAARVGVSPNAPYMWMARNNVPAQYCPAIERETGVPSESLNAYPDWQFLRGTTKKAVKK